MSACTFLQLPKFSPCPEKKMVTKLLSLNPQPTLSTLLYDAGAELLRNALFIEKHYDSMVLTFSYIYKVHILNLLK